MWSPVILNDNTTYPYGFGWELDETVSGMRVVKHNGTWQGFQSKIITILDIKLTFVTFANLDHTDLDDITSHVLQIYHSQFALKSSEDE